VIDKVLIYKLFMVPSDLKKGSAQMLILSLLEERSRHGYEIAQLIEARSGAEITVNSATLYPTLHALEKAGLIKGRWLEQAGTRRRRHYQITAAGRRTLTDQRATWQRFLTALNRVARIGEVPQ
jgi:PadR family transcriptional regulator PadR